MYRTKIYQQHSKVFEENFCTTSFECDAHNSTKATCTIDFRFDIHDNL